MHKYEAVQKEVKQRARMRVSNHVESLREELGQESAAMCC